MKGVPGRAIAIAVLTSCAGLILFAIVLAIQPPQAVRSWLLAALFFLGLSLGGLLAAMIHDLTGGRWGEALRPSFLALAGALPWPLLAMALPLIRSRDVLVWTTIHASLLPDSARAKQVYFDATFLTARTLVIFAIWLVIAWGVLTRPAGSAQARRWSVVGLILVMVTAMIFVTDWMLGPEPDFYSTVYPVLELSGQIVGAFSFAIVILVLLDGLNARAAVARDVLLSEDIANLFFGFILLWVYLAFMQWLIVWSGNLPEEIGWYLRRSAGPWLALLVALIALHFVIPFAALLSRRVKRSPEALAAVAAVVLVGHLVDVIWRSGPPLVTDAMAAGMSCAAFLGVGGCAFALFAWRLEGSIVTVRSSCADA